jgi:hypothetical protein
VTYEPPADPWQPIEKLDGSGSYVSVYLSSDLARLPIRDVTRLGDNKSDPNLETMTYGLFSTCEPIMRGSIKARGISEILFLTTVGELGRCLVGHYQLGWFVEFGDNDVALAATSMRFVEPIPLARIEGRAGAEINKKIRNFQIVGDEVAADLRGWIDGSRDRSADYLEEIARLERMSLSRTGYSYPSWDRKDAFSWADAGAYLAELPEGHNAPNTSPSGKWICTACQTEIINVARLKICNICKSRGALEPIEVEP